MFAKRLTQLGVAAAIAGAWTLALSSQSRDAAGEWRYFGGDKAFTRYSPLDQITAANVKDLRIVWRQPAVDPAFLKEFPTLRVNGNFRSTPLMIGGVLYSPNAVGLLRALDPGTGATLWEQAPFARTAEEAFAQSMRGADFWRSGGDQRLLLVRGEYLYAVNAETGRPVATFGEGGRVSLRWPTPLPSTGAGRYAWRGGPIVVGDVVIIGGEADGSGDSGSKREALPEDIRGYDVKTGRLLWTFHVVPREGEFGYDTWENGSAREAGDLNMWCCFSADEELGYVYVPVSAPTVAYYGGWRPGDNLFSNSLVALDARTGRRVWHFQMVHHDLWESDTAGPATLGDIVVDGRRIQAVMQPSKTGFLYVFDRVTGKPVWPIEERPVPQSTTPGERTSPTQPFPTKPPPFDRQGITVDDLIDFTPELRARAKEIVEPFELGSLFTPPSVPNDAPGGKKGTLLLPGVWGAGNWNTGAFDPETMTYYAVSHTIPEVYDLHKPDESDATLDYTVLGSPRHARIAGPEGLPLVKPPYGRITAIDMSRGEIKWVAANGNGPRDHPLLQGLNLPPLGVPSRSAPLVTKSVLFLGEGNDFSVRNNFEKKFRAFDKATGAVLAEVELPSGVTGAPITYLHNGKQYVVVTIGGVTDPPEWIALGLP